jgi:beta-lactamase regulating signal transducer with metallopeptidase domain
VNTSPPSLTGELWQIWQTVDRALPSAAMGFASLAARAALVLLVSYGVVWLLRSRSAALRHAVWAAALAASLMLPLASVVVPPLVPRAAAHMADGMLGWLADLRSGAGAPARGRPPASSTRRAAPVGLGDGGEAREPEATPPLSPRVARVLAVAWLLGFLAAASRIIVSHLTARHLITRARRVRAPHVLAVARALAGRPAPGPALLSSTEVAAPCTSGLLRPAVILPAAATSWSAEHLRTVLTHEFAHVARRDCLTDLLAQVACAVYWFDPLHWRALRLMRLEYERACDDVVLGAGAPPHAYASLLVSTARAAQHGAQVTGAALAMARPSELESRLLGILDPRRDRRAPSPPWTLALAGLTCGTLVLAGALRLDAEPVRSDVTGDGWRGAARATRAPGGEPDTLGDSVASPRSERVVPVDLARARAAARAALRGRDSALARDLQRSLGRAPLHDADLVRERAAWALAQVRDGQLVAPLLERLGDPDWRVRAYAAWALAPARDPRATPMLMAQLGSAVWRERAMAAHVLAESGDPRARTAMAVALADGAWQVRLGAVEYLGRLADAGDLAALRVAARDPHVLVRAAAREALERAPASARQAPSPP